MKTEINLPGYRIVDFIHQGNFTIVYRALRLSDDQEVVVKTLTNPFPSKSEIAYLAREAETLRSIDIGGVSQVIDLLTYENRPALVLKEMKGVVLSQFLKTQPLTLHKFLELAICITRILAKLHDHNIMHKDINPENIIVTEDGANAGIIDFGIATRLTRERASILNPNVLEGTLLYMSPEQTGRMNRSTDYRTDFYSLGLTFYKMLTGELPFEASDAMEQMHSHIARNMTPLFETHEGIPKVISDIILKLTAKIADDRYQSAGALERDLVYALQCLKESGDIPEFEIAKGDVISRFRIPEKLYGREEELKILLHAFEDSASGNCNLMLIKGFAGIGKTALINEIHKPNLRKKGYFISGKFDQFKSNVPFNAFILAFNDLFQQLVSESTEKIDVIKKSLTEALALNAPVLTDLVPRFDFFVGRQANAHQLSPSQAQSRFFFTLRDFIGAIATNEHPLTIFIDDLQWADDASLRLIHDIVKKEIPYLLIIGAYRDNEVTPVHPLSITLNDISKTKSVTEISLPPLTEENVNNLISDSLMCTPADAHEFALLIHKRTAGNPFYINELLKNLYKNGLINFDNTAHRWTWEYDKIKALSVTGNVVDFMSGRLKYLPQKCLELLKLAACVGNTFKVSTLAYVTGADPEQVAKTLWPAIEQEIITSIGKEYSQAAHEIENEISYKFLHDRIQQTAYTLIDSNEKGVMHLTIARSLMQNMSDAERNELLIEIVRHYNHGEHLITDADERMKLAGLNLEAGTKAQSSVAYASALQYFKAGIDLLPAGHWNNHHQLSYALYKGLAQNAYQTNQLEVAESGIRTLLEHSKTNFDKAEILAMQARQYLTINKAHEAIKAGIEGLALLGIKLSANPGALTVLGEVLKVKLKVGKRRAADLLNMPVMTDPEKLLAARLLMEIGPPAYVVANDNLYGLTSLKVLSLCLQYGNCAQASFAYIAYGAVLAEAFGDYKGASEFGNLGVDLNEKLNDIEYRCRTIAAYGVLTHHRDHHMNQLGDFFKKGVIAGYQSGDLFFLSHCAANTVFWNPSIDLKSRIAEQEKYNKIIRDAGFQDGLDGADMYLQLMKNFAGLTTEPLGLSDAYFDEEQRLAEMRRRNYLPGLCMYYMHKSSLYLYHEEYQKSYEASLEGFKYIKSMVSFIYLPRFSFNTFMACTGYIMYGNNPPVRKLKKLMRKEYLKIKKLAQYNPTNYYHLQLMMEAEQANVDNKPSLAAAYYERAIKATNDNNWPAYEAMANELAGKFYYRNKIRKAASGYMQEAYFLYSKWGAEAKLRVLKQNYPKLMATVLTSIATNPTGKIFSASFAMTDGSHTQMLDMATIVKSSQTISGEIELEKLLNKMMILMLENAGAQRGVFLLEDNGAMKAVVEMDDKLNINFLKNVLLSDYDEIPHTVVNYVMRTSEPLVLENAVSEGIYTTDPYILKNNSRSVFCIPVMSQAKLNGILYLENNLAAGAFTHDRIQVLKLLASQASISLQNAKLYHSTTLLNQSLKNEIEEKIKFQEDLIEKDKRLEIANQTLEYRVTERTAELSKILENLKTTQAQLIHSEKMASLGQLTAGIAHEIKNPLNFVNNFASLTQDLMDELMTAKDDNEKNELIHDITSNLEKIATHGKRADSIVTSMLRHSREGTSEKHPTDINMLIKDSLNFSYHSLKAQIQNFDCNIVSHLEDNLPKANVIFEDINRVILNMLNNAMQAMDEKKLRSPAYKPELIVTTLSDKNFIIIKIRDNGDGISDEIQSKIFEPFFTTKPPGQGTGLGLSLSYEIVKNHGGNITLESTPGMGCEFSIQLPL